jgi:outer membrane protein assembly factor BamD
MKSFYLKVAAVGFLFFIALSAPGCGSSEPEEQLSPEKRFNVGMRLFNNEDYQEAIDQFRIITLQYQGSSVAGAAQYYLAESRFMRGEYILAAYEYDQLVRTMPTSPYVTKARYKRALCYYKLSPPYYLDQTYTRKAIDEFQAYIEFSPSDSLVPDAESKIMEMNTKLAEKEYHDGIIYMKMDYYRAATVYFEDVIEKYHDTPYAELAQLKKAEALSDRHKSVDAMTELETFYRKYPNSKHKKEADELLTKLKQQIMDEKAEAGKAKAKQQEAATQTSEKND